MRRFKIILKTEATRKLRLKSLPLWAWDSPQRRETTTLKTPKRLWPTSTWTSLQIRKSSICRTQSLTKMVPTLTSMTQLSTRRPGRDSKTGNQLSEAGIERRLTRRLLSNRSIISYRRINHWNTPTRAYNRLTQPFQVKTWSWSNKSPISRRHSQTQASLALSQLCQ